MLKNNEGGFTLAESLLSLMVIAMLAAFILPLMGQMTGQSKALWERQKGMRLLYEEGAKQMIEGEDFHVVYEREGEKYDISWETSIGSACFEVSGEVYCIKKQ
ncbi:MULTISPECIES: type II secretion system protein [Bacillaceae]|uniref:type II secretion system protein n=1 Tax=Bacillaceae TaxID=186817 RepID=UPI0016040346|nr:type II secretion system protein [Bacillus sp. PK3_68]